MQKRLLALVATVAMVLSMFAGVAFATEEEPVEPRHFEVSPASGETLYLGDTIEIEAPGADDVRIMLWAEELDNVEDARASYGDKLFSARLADLITNGLEGTRDVENGVFAVTITQDLIDYMSGYFGPTTWLITPVMVKEDGGNAPWEEYKTWDGSHVDETFFVFTIAEERPEEPGEEPTPEPETELPDEIKLNKTKVISSLGNVDYELITGTLLLDGKLYSEDAKIVVPVLPESQREVAVKDGRFSFYLPTNLKPQDVTLSVKVDGEVVADVTAKIEVRFNVETTPEKLEFAFTDEQNPITITGKVTNSKGEPMKDIVVTLNSYFTDVRTNDKGEFGYVVLKWDAAEDLSLKLTGPGTSGDPNYFPAIEHAKGKVTAKAATLKVTPNSGVVHSVVGVEFTVSGSAFGDVNTRLESLQVKDGDTVVYNVGSFKTLPKLADGEFEDFKFTWKPEAAGTYKLVAEVENYTAEATITVVNPANYNLINSSKLTKLEVRPDNDFKIGTDIYLVNHKGQADDYVYTVYVDGKLAKNNDGEDEVFEKLESGTLRIAATELATHSIRVVVHKGDSKVFDQTYTAVVSGWDVEMDVTELTVNKAQDITFVVKDKDGNAINNAYIEIEGVATLKPSTYNAQNGVYVFEDVKVKLPGTLTITVKTGDEKDTMAILELPVVGQKVWTVTANKDTLLQGKGEDVELTVTQDGDAVTPWLVKWVYEDGTSSAGVRPTYVGEGVSKVKINAAEAGKLIVRVENIDGTLCGETTIEVVAPKLVLIDEEVANLTNNFKTKVHFKVVDPRDDSVIKSNLELVADYLESDDIELWDANDGVTGTTILGAEEHILTILAKVDEDAWDAAAEDEEVVAIAFEIDGTRVDGVFEVKDATITSDPEMIIIGAKNNLTLTYLDANGKPIEGKAVKANGTKIGETDANGQVVYPAGVVASAVEVTADTDVKDVTVDKTIKIGYDFEAPQVTYEVDGNKATLIITDNVRLVRININGEEIDFWPGARYDEYVVNLVPGVNKVRVKAQDSNDNVLDEVVEIEYKTDSIVLKDDKVQRQGDYLFVQARQFEEFGAKFAWNGETRTATFVIGDDKVEVTIGSTTAVVNGEAVTMPVAAFIADGRTYVPVRFVSENLGWNVHWAQGDIVTITLP